MPTTAAAAALAAASMAGIPLFGGFIAKEQLYGTIRTSPFSDTWGVVLTAAAVAASMCLGAAGLIAGVAPFRGRSMPTPAARDAPVFLWLGPLVLGVAGVILGLFPGLVSVPIALRCGLTVRTRSRMKMKRRRAIRTDESAVAGQDDLSAKKRLDDWLDGALADTFPASDPVATPPADAAPAEGDRPVQNQSPPAATTSQRSRR
jgi:hypothetical protein